MSAVEIEVKTKHNISSISCLHLVGVRLFAVRLAKTLKWKKFFHHLFSFVIYLFLSFSSQDVFIPAFNDTSSTSFTVFLNEMFD